MAQKLLRGVSGEKIVTKALALTWRGTDLVKKALTWGEREIERGHDPNAPFLKEFARGFAAFGLFSLKIGLGVLAVGLLGQAFANRQGEGSGSGARGGAGSGIESALNELEGPLKAGLCRLREIVVPALFVAAIVAIGIGGILKAFQSRAAGPFLIGGVLGVVFAIVAMFVVSSMMSTAMSAAGTSTDWRAWCK